MQIEDDVRRVLSRIQPAGGLQEHLEALATELIANDYTPHSTREYL